MPKSATFKIILLIFNLKISESLVQFSTACASASKLIYKLNIKNLQIKESTKKIEA